MSLERPFAVVAILLGVSCASQQQESDRPPKVDLSRSNEEIVAQLAEYVSSLPGFVATYRISDEPEESLRVIYAAPDRAKMEQNHSDNVRTIFWLTDSNLVVHHVHAEQEGVFATAEFSLDEIVGQFDMALEREFPSGKELRPGPFFDLQFELDEGSEEHGTFNFMLGRSPAGGSFLHWLRRPDKWVDARRAGNFLVRETAGGKFEEHLSLTSGFIEEIRFPGDRRLQLVDLVRSVDESGFEIPHPRDGARDETETFRRMMYRTLLSPCREAAYGAGIKAVNGTDYDADELRRKMRNVLESLYRPAIKAGILKWSDEAAKSVDGFLEWFEQREAETRDDPAPRENFEVQTFEWEFELKRKLSETLRKFVAKLPRPELKSCDPECFALITRIDDEVLKAVYEQEVVSPLLDRLHRGMRGEGR